MLKHSYGKTQPKSFLLQSLGNLKDAAYRSLPAAVLRAYQDSSSLRIGGDLRLRFATTSLCLKGEKISIWFPYQGLSLFPRALPMGCSSDLASSFVWLFSVPYMSKSLIYQKTRVLRKCSWWQIEVLARDSQRLLCFRAGCGSTRPFYVQPCATGMVWPFLW